MARETSVLITFERPRGVSDAELREFIIRELECGGGNLHPDDPLFNSLHNVRVSKPIVPWRDPAIPAKKGPNVVTLKKRGA